MGKRVPKDGSKFDVDGYNRLPALEATNGRPLGMKEAFDKFVKETWGALSKTYLRNVQNSAFLLDRNWRLEAGVIRVVLLLTGLITCGLTCKPNTPAVKSCGTFSFRGSIDSDSTGDPAGLFQLGFVLDPARCNLTCGCGKVWFIQVLRATDTDTGQQLQPNATQQARIVKSNDPVLDGWAIDRKEGSKYGYYHLLNDGVTLEPASGIPDEIIKFGSVGVAAQMHDTIARGHTLWKNRNMMIEGLVVPVCLDKMSACQENAFGVLGWYMIFKSDGTVFKPEPASGISAKAQLILTLSINEWNAHLGGQRVELPQYVFSQ